MKIDDNGNYNNEDNANIDNFNDEDDTSMNRLIELMEFEKEQASSKLMHISGNKRRNDDENEWSTFKIPKIEPKSKKTLNTIDFSNYKLPLDNNHYHQHKIKSFQPTNLSIHKEQINGFSTDKA